MAPIILFVFFLFISLCYGALVTGNFAANAVVTGSLIGAGIAKAVAVGTALGAGLVKKAVLGGNLIGKAILKTSSCKGNSNCCCGSCYD